MRGGVQHSIVDINHRFVCECIKTMTIDSFMCSFDHSMFSCWFFFRFVLFCFVLDSFTWKMFSKSDWKKLEHWQQFWWVLMSADCLTMMTSHLRERAILLLHLIWTGFENLLWYYVDLPSDFNYHPTAMLQINWFLMWKKGDDFTLIAIHKFYTFDDDDEADDDVMMINLMISTRMSTKQRCVWNCYDTIYSYTLILVKVKSSID